MGQLGVCDAQAEPHDEFFGLRPHEHRQLLAQRFGEAARVEDRLGVTNPVGHDSRDHRV